MLVRVVRLVRLVRLVSVVLTCQVLGLIMPPLQRCRHPTGPPDWPALTVQPRTAALYCDPQLGDQLLRSRSVLRSADDVDVIICITGTTISVPG